MVPAWQKDPLERFLHHVSNAIGGTLISALCVNVGWWLMWQNWPGPLVPVFKWAVIVVLFAVGAFMVLFTFGALRNLERTPEEERLEFEAAWLETNSDN